MHLTHPIQIMIYVLFFILIMLTLFLILNHTFHFLFSIFHAFQGDDPRDLLPGHRPHTGVDGGLRDDGGQSQVEDPHRAHGGSEDEPRQWREDC